MPKVNEAEQFYFYDLLANAVILTDLRGNLFSLDPQTLKATPIKNKPATQSAFSHAYANRIYHQNGERISLTGDLRKHIELGQKNAGEESFLSGAILLEQADNKLSATAKQMMLDYRSASKKMQDEYDSLLHRYPVLEDQRKAHLTIKDYQLLNHFYDLKNNLEHLARDSEQKKQEIIQSLSGIALGGDSNTLYILHANNLTDTSSILISKVSILNNKASSQWTTMVPNIYFNPSKGVKVNRMADRKSVV